MADEGSRLGLAYHQGYLCGYSMGKRDQYETVTGVIRAFADTSVWKQSELARHLSIESRHLKKVLTNLQLSGIPLQSEEDHPHVIWSVPKKWFPGGVFFDQGDWQVLVHAVLHIPDEPRRNKMLARLLNGNIIGNVNTGIERLERGLLGQPVTPEVHHAILLVQQAVLESYPLRMEYYSASSGKMTERSISPQKFLPEPHPRLVAYCHENEELRWFRLDNIKKVELDRTMPIFESDLGEVERFIAASPDGFHDGTDTEWSFRISGQASAWVKGNLLSGMKVLSDRSDGMQVSVRGGALVVARFIVSLGASAQADQPELRQLVRDLAQESLDANSS